MSNAEWTKVILAKMHGVLKPRGFRKRGASFARTIDDDVILVVNLQKSTSSDNAQARMTVNLGVLSLMLARIASGQGQIGSPSVWGCHWRQRLGFLMPVRSDK